MKINKNCKKIVVFLCMLILAGCAGTKITGNQQDAIIKSAGNALGLALTIAKPELTIPLKIYCQRFLIAKDAVDGGEVFNLFLSYLNNQYIGDPRINVLVVNFLTVIGISQQIAEDYVAGKIDKTIGKEGFTADMLHKAMLGMTGFCEMI